ncbi:TPA: radical SAM protein [Candidatus Poribacteria bacterium]|nr:radical SAM protein [Candidatus Poribacteria bacterium]
MKKSHSSKVDPDFPYRRLPYINFYQYPPLEPIDSVEGLSLSERLALDRPMEWDPIFTIFVSIPYCLSRCHSCPFFKNLLPSRVDKHALLDDYLDCLNIPIQKYANTVRFASARCGALYIGGGTASLLDPDQVDSLIRAINGSFTMDSSVEVTLEGNPREFSREYLQQVRESGVTRVSIGFQSTQDTLLRKVINSPHDGNTSLKSVKDALAVGFDSVNVDLLYRLPGQTIEHWRHDIQTIIEFEPESITIYPYGIHSGSAAERLIKRGSLERPVDEDTAYEWYLWAKEQLKKRGYVEQRKSGFIRLGHEQKYGKLSYVKGCEIVGLGAGAYSFINQYQFRAPKDAELYKEQARRGSFPVVSELSVQATNRNMMERYVIFNFFASSLNRKDFNHRFGQDPLDVFPQIFSRLKRHGLVTIGDKEIRLTDLGKRWRNNVFYEFYSFKK